MVLALAESALPRFVLAICAEVRTEAGCVNVFIFALQTSFWL